MSPLRRLQNTILVVGVVACLGIVVELATARHWNGFIQLIPWIATGVAIVAAALSRGSQRRFAMVLLAGVLVSSLFGMWEHLESNYSAGPLDGRYERTWSDLGTGEKAWKALSMDVGKSPPFVPGALALSAILIGLSIPGARTRGSASASPDADRAELVTASSSTAKATD